ncbi:MAG: SGNH/GDSL hydrolase family protein [Lentisphaeria bacterium]
MDDIIKPRGPLARFKQAIQSGKVRVGFIGGSITEAHRESNWPYFIRAWFVKKFPGVRAAWENAAIGGTGSLSGVMRAQRDLLDTRCDIVFVEYAVNDGPGEATMRTREGLIRKLLEEERDVILVYTYCQDMYAAMSAGQMPASIVELEILAEHYCLPSVWMGLHAYNEMKAGRMTWEGWLPDGLHPDYLGSSIYAEPVIAFLEAELAGPARPSIPSGALLPAPHTPNHFQDIREIPLDDAELRGPWTEMREVILPWYRTALCTAADGAELSLHFTGRALCAMLNFGKTSGVLKYRFDGGEWREFTGERCWWVPDKNWCQPVLLADDLSDGAHRFDLRVVHGNREECKGTTCKIFTFMAVQ